MTTKRDQFLTVKKLGIARKHEAAEFPAPLDAALA